MWPSFLEDLNLPGWTPELVEFETDDTGEVINGAIKDLNSEKYFIIQDGILDLLDDALADRERRIAFSNKYFREFSNHQLKNKENSKEQYFDSDHLVKLKQLKHHDSEASEYDDNLSNTPFGIGADKILFKLWDKYLQLSKVIVDLGCGTGRRSLKAIEASNASIICVDISFNMALFGRKKCHAAGYARRVNFCVGDAEKSLFKPNIADIVMATGVLHHASNPQLLISVAKDLLHNRGFFLSYENNKSSLRFLFDWIQKVFPAWHEEAGRHHVISENDLMIWINNVRGLDVLNFRYHIFLPPQIFNVLGVRLACIIMKLSDFIGNKLDFFKYNAGIVIIEIQKEEL